MASNGATLSNIQLTAQPGGGCGGGGTGSGTGNLRTFTITIPAHNGPCPITMAWIVRNETNFPSAGGITCGNNFNNNNPCQNDGRNANYCPCPIVVQAAYAGNDDLSGPIRTAHLINMSGS